MSCRPANSCAAGAVRDATATTWASLSRARSSVKRVAMPPVARMPHRIGSCWSMVLPAGGGTAHNDPRNRQAQTVLVYRRGVDAYLLDAVRTPFGRHRGGLAGIRTDDLAALPIIELRRRYPALADEGRVDDVMLGDTNQAGEDNRNVARMAALLAGLAPTVPGVTLNRLCASGGEAIVQAARAVATGDAELII